MKLYKAYASYGRNPIADSNILEMVKQNSKKWQGKPVCKLYVRKSVGHGRHYDRTFLLKAYMDSGMTYEEACKKVD
jgi:hypothetical protein